MLPTKNKDFLHWLRRIPAADRRDRLQELLCARAINRTSARAALDKLQLNPFVVLQRLDGVVGMINAARFRNAEIVGSDIDEEMDVVSETDSCFEEISDCENELPVKSTSSTEKTCDNESSAQAASSAEEISVCCNELPAQTTSSTEETCARNNALSSQALLSAAAVKENKNNTDAPQAVKEDVIFSVCPSGQSDNLDSNRISSNTNDNLNILEVADMTSDTIPKKVDDVNNVTQIAEHSMKPSPLSVESNETARHLDQASVSVSQITNLIIEKHLAVSGTEAHLLNNSSHQPTVVPENAEKSKESDTSCITKDTAREEPKTTQNLDDSCLSDLAQCVYDTELLLLRLNRTIKECASLSETDRYPAILRALLESSSQLKEQHNILQSAFDKGVSRRLGRQFYPKLLQEINSKTPYTLYSSMRLATMISMIENLRDPSRDPKFIFNSFVAATLQKSGESRQERTVDSVSQATSAIASVSSQHPTRARVKDSRILAGQKVKVKTFNTPSETPVLQKASATRSPPPLSISSANRQQPPSSSVVTSVSSPALIAPSAPQYFQPVNGNGLACAAQNTLSVSSYSPTALDTISSQNRVTQGNPPLQATGTRHHVTHLSSNALSPGTANTTLRDLLSQSQPVPSSRNEGFARCHPIQLSGNHSSMQSQPTPLKQSRLIPSIGNQTVAQTQTVPSNGNQSFAQSQPEPLSGNIRLGLSQSMPSSDYQSLAQSQQPPMPSTANQTSPQSFQMQSAGNQRLHRIYQMTSTGNHSQSQMPSAGNRQSQQMSADNQSSAPSQLALFSRNRGISHNQIVPSSGNQSSQKHPVSLSGTQNVTVSQSYMQQYQMSLPSVMPVSIIQDRQTTHYQQTGNANFALAPQNSTTVQSGQQIVRTAHTVQQSQKSVSNAQAYNPVSSYISQTNYQSAYRTTYPQQSAIAVVLPNYQQRQAPTSSELYYQNEAPFNGGTVNTQQNSNVNQPFFQQQPVTLTQPVMSENFVTQVTSNPMWIGGYAESNTSVGTPKAREPTSLLPNNPASAVMAKLSVVEQTSSAMHVPQFEKAVVSSGMQHQSSGYLNQLPRQHTATAALVTGGTQTTSETAQGFGQRYYGPGSGRPVPSAAARKVYGSAQASQPKPVGYVIPEIPLKSTGANVPNNTFGRSSVAAVNKDAPVAKVVMQVSPDTRACSRDSGIFTPEPGQEVDSNERLQDELFGADDRVKVELMRVRGERTMKVIGIERLSNNIGIDRPSVITTVSQQYFTPGDTRTMHSRY